MVLFQLPALHVTFKPLKNGHLYYTDRVKTTLPDWYLQESFKCIFGSVEILRKVLSMVYLG